MALSAPGGDTLAAPASARKFAQRTVERSGVWLLLLVLVSLNLRPLLTSVSPLLPDIRSATGMGFQTASMLTVLPMVAMGIVGLAGARIGSRIGDRHGISAGLLAIAIACACRWFAGSAATLVFSAALAGVGIALIQALIPGVIKHNHATRISAVMGLYSAAMMGGGLLGAIVGPWSAQLSGDWHLGLGMWAIPAAFTLLLWTAVRVPMPPFGKVGTGSATANPRPMRPMYRNARAWLLAIYFGWMNCAYTSLIAWLPPFYVERGWSMQSSGALLGAMTAAQMVASIVLPLLAARGTDRRPWLAAGFLAQFAGFAGLIAGADRFAFVWVSVLGFGLGGLFALCLILALDHLKDPRRAGALAAFVQAIGYLISAAGPIVTGFIRDLTGSFVAAWIMLACSVVALLCITLRFNPATYQSTMHGME
ncbi:MFS transporter [Noviherbaspirillum cavernae]|uniref:MFS transporter n=1 Tax=Noviherbaspirillum cavernae TaxID=2320862 RepID=A0A418WV18_9BURK|nr:cyanate transporter [Noviherbaspirillum cavernae]RJF96503.1 MFS transporter [Noviherbaspirillum cavernae]